MVDIKRNEVSKKTFSFPISVEFFPPKNADGLVHLCDVASTLSQYHPTFYSVTFGAGGSTRAGTIEAVELLQQKTKVEVAPHIACMGLSRDEILEILHGYQAVNIKRIVALRGDLPSGMVQAGDFKYASELVRFVRAEMGDQFCIEVAAYPEIHPQAQYAIDDVLNLKRKYEAGANGAITQYFFNPDAYFYFLDECAKCGINMPIVPGVMPITQFTKLERFSSVCGAEIPRWIRKRLESYGDDSDSIKAFGVEVVFRLCERLMAGGAPGLHFYALNRAHAIIALLEMLYGVSIKKSPQTPTYDLP